MRIISGKNKGLELVSPPGHKTHPMSEKLRGAIFNALGDISDLTIFDPFCGTAAIAIEGLSRGAKSAVCIDSSLPAHEAAKQNILKAKATNSCQLFRMNSSVWSDQNLDRKFNLIFLDPPFDSIKFPLLERLIERHAASGAIVICNLPSDIKPEFKSGFDLLQTNPHGDATLWFYRKLS